MADGRGRRARTGAAPRMSTARSRTVGWRCTSTATAGAKRPSATWTVPPSWRRWTGRSDGGSCRFVARIPSVSRSSSSGRSGMPPVAPATGWSRRHELMTDRTHPPSPRPPPARTSCAGPRRWPPSPAPGSASRRASTRQERFEEVLHIAGDIRASLAADAELDVEHYVDEWMRSVGEGVAGYVTPKSAIGAVVYDDAGPHPARAAGRLRRVAVPHRLGRRRLLAGRGGGEGGARGDGHRVRARGRDRRARRDAHGHDAHPALLHRVPLPGHRRRAAGAPARDPRRGLVRRGRAPGLDDRRAAVGPPCLRGHPWRAAPRAVRPAPSEPLAPR